MEHVMNFCDTWNVLNKVTTRCFQISILKLNCAQVLIELDRGGIPRNRDSTGRASAGRDSTVGIPRVGIPRVGIPRSWNSASRDSASQVFSVCQSLSRANANRTNPKLAESELCGIRNHSKLNSLESETGGIRIGGIRIRRNPNSASLTMPAMLAIMCHGKSGLDSQATPGQRGDCGQPPWLSRAIGPHIVTLCKEEPKWIQQ